MKKSVVISSKIEFYQDSDDMDKYRSGQTIEIELTDAGLGRYFVIYEN